MKKIRNRTNYRHGFTLIELLVVISIIALLVSILMPALSKAREQAKATTCAAQLRQFGMAWFYYAEENDDYNISYGYVSPLDTGGFWFYKLGEYLGGDERFTKGDADVDTKKGALNILNCPSAKPWSNKFNDSINSMRYGGADMAWQWRGEAVDREHEGGYTINGWMQPGIPDSTNYPSGYFYKKYSKPKADVPLICDGGWVDTWPKSDQVNELVDLIDLQGSGIPGASSRMYPNNFTRIVLDRHALAINIVFKDTRVEKVPLEDLGSFEWHKGFKTTNYIELP